MKTILQKFWIWFKTKSNAITLIVILLLFGMGITIYIQGKNNKSLENKYENEVKLKNALIDTIHTHINKEGELVAEKLTLQGSLTDLTKMYGQLTSSEQELINRVKELNNKSDVIAAALIQSNVKIDSLMHKGTVDIDTSDKKIAFIETKNTNINYDFEVDNVIPAYKNIQPSFLIKDLSLPNKSMISFEFDKTKGNPVSFSVSNSNPYFHVANIDSYAIPNINKDIVKPTGLQKVLTWIKTTGKVILISGVIGIIAGHCL